MPAIADLLLLDWPQRRQIAARIRKACIVVSRLDPRYDLEVLKSRTCRRIDGWAPRPSLVLTPERKPGSRPRRWSPPEGQKASPPSSPAWPSMASPGGLRKPVLPVTLHPWKPVLPVTLSPRKPVLLETETGTFSDSNRYFQRRPRIQNRGSQSY